MNHKAIDKRIVLVVIVFVPALVLITSDPFDIHDIGGGLTYTPDVTMEVRTYIAGSYYWNPFSEYGIEKGETYNIRTHGYISGTGSNPVSANGKRTLEITSSTGSSTNTETLSTTNTEVFYAIIVPLPKENIYYYDIEFKVTLEYPAGSYSSDSWDAGTVVYSCKMVHIDITHTSVPDDGIIDPDSTIDINSQLNSYYDRPPPVREEAPLPIFTVILGIAIISLYKTFQRKRNFINQKQK